MAEKFSTERVGTSLTLAAGHLRRGGIVAFPTETYYGLAVDPNCAPAVNKLFAAKQRVENKPLLLLIEDKEQLAGIVEEVPPLYVPLINRYWPGPLTLVFPAQTHVNKQITGDTGTVGVRISPHPLAQQLVRRMGKPITATSANISGCSPACSAAEVVEMLGDMVDYIVDGGPSDGGLCSTVVGIKNGRLCLFRRGRIELSSELTEDYTMNALQWDKQFALEQAADDAELLEELLEIFKDALQADLLLIEQGLAENSAGKIMAAAHSIKGAAASLGILGIFELARQIEEDSRAGGIELARAKIGALQEMLQELKSL